MFQALYADSQNSFWLDGGMHAASGMSYLGDAASVVEARSWAQLRSAIGEHAAFSEAVRERSAGAGACAGGGGGAGASGGADGGAGAHSAAEPRFQLGWVGWLSYELGTLDEEQAGHGAGSEHPLAVFLRVERAVEIDHASGAITLLAAEGPDAERWLESTARRLEAVATHLAPGAHDSGDPAEPELAEDAHTPLVATPRHDSERYAALVDGCRSLIVRGEAYQLCLTNQFTVAVNPDPLDTYLRLRRLSPSHHGGYLRVGGTALLSASPERFLAVGAEGTISTRPIKGTRGRGRSALEDALLADELVRSEKERAENLMIVDLMRNDLARVCELGTVRVEELFAIESYPQVHQLVSTVEGRLREGLSALDAVAACFPAGSMTGAPKRSAMQHLAALEGGPRGLYAGAFGYISVDGAMDLAMIIRSIVLMPEGATVGAGGGITALSETRDEVAETLIKAGPLLAVLGARPPDRREHAKV